MAMTAGWNCTKPSPGVGSVSSWMSLLCVAAYFHSLPHWKSFAL